LLLTVENLTVTNCTAEYSWESGFHFEASPTEINCKLINCVSNYNGQRDMAFYGYGYMGDPRISGGAYVGKDITYTNCIGTGNKNGLFGANPSPGPEFYTYKVSSNVVLDSDGGTAYTAANFTAALKWAVESHPSTITYVPTGTYTVTTAVYPAAGTALVGDGPEANETVLNFTGTPWGSGCITIDTVDNVYLKGFRMTGNGAVYIRNASGTHGNYTIQDVTAYYTGNTQKACFQTFVYKPGILDGFNFVRCSVINANTDGFCFYGDWVRNDDIPIGTDRLNAGIVKNITFTDCVAQYCGINSRYDNYTCGWRLNEGVNAENVYFLRCNAEHNWDNGFHIEPSGGAVNVVYEDCDSSYNGSGVPSNYGAGAGWTWTPRDPYLQDVTLINCTGSGNYNALDTATDDGIVNGHYVYVLILPDLPPPG
jgi:hypothetical protein